MKTHRTADCRAAWSSILSENNRLESALRDSAKALKMVENRIVGGRYDEAKNIALSGFNAANEALENEGCEAVVPNPFFNPAA